LDDFDPLAILGCSLEQAQIWLRGRRVTPGEVEAAAAKHYRWRAHLNDEAPYWVTVGQAARLLQVPRSEVLRMLASGSVQHIRHVSGTRLIRRDLLPGVSASVAAIARQ
jgi:excisionase family DNA binding protein